MASASSIRASAPGSLMLLGEHAVLHGRRALACAVNRRITVTLAPRADRAVNLASALGTLATDLDRLAPAGPFRFVLAALASARPERGLDIAIVSEFSDRVGLGSSAAVTVATLAALDALGGREPVLPDLQDRSLSVIRAVQGTGSGTDAAASVLGGLVAYRTAPREVHKLAHTHPLALVYCGVKTPTPEVVAHVERRRREDPALFDALFNEIDRSVNDAVAAAGREDWAEVGAILNANQGYLVQMGVSTDELDEIVDGLRASPGVLGAKISGSGLGDCAVGLGVLTGWALPYEVIEVEMSEDGVRVE